MKFVKLLSVAEKVALTDLLENSPSSKVRRRAHIILLSSRKFTIELLAQIYIVDRDTVSGYISRWLEFGVAGLYDGKRPGRPKKKENESLDAKKDVQKSKLGRPKGSTNKLKKGYFGKV